MKQSIDQCLADYSTGELMQFHANLNSLFLCCNQDFHLFPLLLHVQFELEQRKEPIAKKYLNKVMEMIATPKEAKNLFYK